MPYGKWDCDDGREVLFDRDYVPIFERRSGQGAVRADPEELIPWKTQNYFYGERESEAVCRKRAEAVLREWGVLDACMEDINRQAKIKSYFVLHRRREPAL
jgi:hypothetical protein